MIWHPVSRQFVSGVPHICSQVDQHRPDLRGPRLHHGAPALNHGYCIMPYTYLSPLFPSPACHLPCVFVVFPARLHVLPCSICCSGA